MKILVACEFSGVVRDAFLAKGHLAISCDLEPSEKPGPHFRGDVLTLLDEKWDMLLAFPPCTYLCCSGARWHSKSIQKIKALYFVQNLLNAPIKRIALENPIGAISTYIRKPDQIIQPWMFGTGETKRSCLWLKGLPPLFSTEIAPGNIPRIHYMSPGPHRAKDRSRTYPCIAQAMADQWG